ncbi:MAG: cellobiose phosphorylase, partial [Actinomycetota bacterium]|nr:cellobiose phosphorylase [Actinomycetota bacterium]
TTNIGAYMWSAVSAKRLGFISRRELVGRLSRTITTLEGMERYADTGQFYNWYDHRTGAKLTSWPPRPQDTFYPILSSVDNAWLAVGLKVVARTVPRLARRARGLYTAMDFGFYYVPEKNRVLFHFRPDDPAASPCCYDTVVSESRIVDYLGIGRRQMPQKTYYGRWRTFPDTCEYAFQETKPVGEWRRYFDVDVFEGAYRYHGLQLVPSWGGSMFEALMPALFVPEERWAPHSWGPNHPLTVQAQIFHGLEEAGYGYWGFSPANKPEGDYGVWGVDGAGMDPSGMPSNADATLVDRGFPGCPDRPEKPDPPPSAYTNGVVTPHAAFLALRYAPRATRANLRRLELDFPGLYGEWGFRDSVNVQTKRVSDFYLSLDQGMIMAALGNALGDDVLRKAFADPALERTVRPVIGVERFNMAP